MSIDLDEGTAAHLFLFPATGQPEGMTRRPEDGMVRLRLSIADRDTFDGLPPLAEGQMVGRAGAVVTDEDTGSVWEVRKSSCGLGCGCSAIGWWLGVLAEPVAELLGLTDSTT